LSSPCIDAGHPGSSFSREPQPNGSSCNVGPHGNTEEASKSLKAEKAKSAVQLNEKFRLQYALSGTAPRRNTLAGNGTLRAENLAWLPDPGESRQTSLKLSGKDERLEITMALDSKTSPKGWLAVDIDPLCDPFRVTSPGGAETPARASGRFLLFRPGQAGIWRIEGLPRKGTLMIPGKFSCKRFRVKFAGGLHTKLVYEHVPGMKKYQFEADDPDADDEAELIVQVEPNTTPLVVKADGEPHEDFDRRGDMIHIRGVLPNVTYQVEKLTAATLPAGE
jgi:hypothetical protein